MKHYSRWVILAALALGMLGLSPAAAQTDDLGGRPIQQQPAPFRQHQEPYALDTRTQGSVETEADGQGRITAAVIRIPDAPWLRIHIGEYALGPDSYLLLTSLEDGGQQRLDNGSLPDWYNASAYFNGDAVRVEVHAAPGDEGAYAVVNQLTVGERGDFGYSPAPIESEPPPGFTESLCGGDSRVASNDDRVGRINGCTAWLVSNGGVLTAGHCTDYDPDGSGPALPNGTVDLSGVMEFDVPASDTDGTPNMAAPNDQYPINTTGIAWRFDGEGQGLGKDWSVFRLNPNSNTGARAHVAQGFYRMTNTNPAVGNTMRITGFGIDDTPLGSTGGRNAQNRTNQTSTGGYVGEFNAGADIWHRYAVDTEPANSGSPIIWDSNGFTVGIHTNGGCNPDGSGSNSGTSFEVNALESALQVFPATNTRYVDLVSATAAETGLIYEPFDTVGEAVTSVPAGGTVSIVEGTYNGAITIVKSVTLIAPVGTAIIR